MKLWLVSQTANNDYDTYSDIVVAAETEDEARKTSPSPDYREWSDEHNSWMFKYHDGRREKSEFYSWVDDLSLITVKYLGETAPEIEAGLILASYHAG